MSRGAVIGALILTALAPACPAPALCEEKSSLIVPEAWQLLPAAEDPFAPPEDAPLCAPEDVRVEPFGVGGPLALDVDTRQGCGWATVEQPLAVDLAVGDEVSFTLFYFSQTSFPAAQAELAIMLGDDEVWQLGVPIPAESKGEFPRFALREAYAAGSPVRFHVGNHGDNTWNLLEMSRIKQVVCEQSARP